MSFARTVQKAVTRAHTAVYRATGGRIGHRLGPVENVLLTTTGRRTGQARTIPLTTLPDGDRLILVASDGGAARHPAWYLNLSADPEVTVQRGADRMRYRARTADPRERAALWPRVVDLYAGYARYQDRTEREIPLVICERA
jgi:deazaflavin-dependent oxidoreductase (nitroreductase family)